MPVADCGEAIRSVGGGTQMELARRRLLTAGSPAGSGDFSFCLIHSFFRKFVYSSFLFF